MFEIAAHWEAGRKRACVHMFYVNDKAVGTRATDVLKAIRQTRANPPVKIVNEACNEAKTSRSQVLKIVAGKWIAENAY